MELATVTLNVRDRAPLFTLPNCQGEEIMLRPQAGKPIVLIFYAQDEIPACGDVATAFSNKKAEFEAMGVLVISISTNSPAARDSFKQKHNIDLPLLCDEDASVSKQYGACYEDKSSGDRNLIFNRVIFLLDHNLRIVKIYNLLQMSDPASEVLADIATFFPPHTPQHITVQAPVLLIPNVLSRSQCQQLIEVWETQGHVSTGYMLKAEGNKTIGSIDHKYKSRKDHLVEDAKLKAYLDNIILRRVFPDIKAAFDCQMSRRESYKIACYDARDRGFFHPHRDNTSGGTAHRQFAMTLNLNDEYEGGYLRFPEHSPNLYRPQAGGVVIFSCSLLHEATPVTEGRRFALLSFFYGEEQAKIKQAYDKQGLIDFSGAVGK